MPSLLQTAYNCFLICVGTAGFSYCLFLGNICFILMSTKVPNFFSKSTSEFFSSPRIVGRFFFKKSVLLESCDYGQESRLAKYCHVLYEVGLFQGKIIV